MYYTYGGAPAPAPVGASHASIYPYGPFETSSGSVMLGIQNEREWVSFCRAVLRMPEIATDARFSTNALRDVNRAELKQIICDVFASITSDEAIALLEEGRIANAMVNDMEGVWEHPQLKARDRWAEIDTPMGKLPALLPPGVPSSAKQERSTLGSIPTIGEHNEKILAELNS
jgi:crotonobetainyl-CoA:carnitine CoA-transferase CaiB-like acyl-CoA transferase